MARMKYKRIRSPRSRRRAMRSLFLWGVKKTSRGYRPKAGQYFNF